MTHMHIQHGNKQRSVLPHGNYTKLFNQVDTASALDPGQRRQPHAISHSDRVRGKYITINKY